MTPPIPTPVRPVRAESVTGLARGEARGFARRALVAFFAAGLAFAPSVARADSDADQEADRLFQEGRALMKEERFAEACPKLERSQALSPHGGVLLNVAACHERIGKIATAWVEFHDALAAAKADGKDDRVRLANERIAALEPRLSWLVVTVPAGAGDGLQLTLDGASISPLAWGKDMPVDPGDHRLVATRPGDRAWSKDLHFAEGDRSTVPIESPAAPLDLPPLLPPKTSPSSTLNVAPTPPPVEEELKHRTVIEVGAFGGATTGGFARPSNADLQKIQLSDQGTSTTCAALTCQFSNETMITGGVTGFAGWSATPRFHVGLRGMLGLHLSGGFLAAVGPSISGRIFGPFWIGWSFFVGDAAERVKVSPPSGTNLAALSSPELTVWDTSGVTVGNGVELSMQLYTTKTSALMLQTLPVFMVTPRSVAITIPVGLSYRFF